MCTRCKNSGIGRIKKGNFAAGIEPVMYMTGGYVGASLLDQVPQLADQPLVKEVIKVVGGIALMAQKGNTTTQIGAGMAVNGLSGLQRMYLPLPSFQSAVAALPGSRRTRRFEVERAIAGAKGTAPKKGSIRSKVAA